MSCKIGTVWRWSQTAGATAGGFGPKKKPRDRMSAGLKIGWLRPTKGALGDSVKSVRSGQGLFRFWLPAATQRFVNGHYAAIKFYLGLRLAVFSGQTLALGIEQD